MLVTNSEKELLDSFALTIKIGAEKVKFTIITKESKDEMFEKLKLIQPQCALKKEQTLKKLKSDLQSKLKTHNVKPNLVKTIQYYLAQNFGEDQSSIQRAVCHKNDKKPTLVTTRHFSLKDSPAHIKPDLLKQSQKGQKKGLEPQKKELAKKQGFIQTKQKSLSKVQSQPKKQAVNQDLIKAYQTIMQKSTQVDIKMMAKKCLEELGKLPQPDRNKQPIVPTKLYKEPSPSKPSQDIRTHQKQQNKHSQSNEKSPIELINTQNNKRQPNSHVNYNSWLDRSKNKLSDSPLSKDYRTARYNYSINNNLSSLQRTSENVFELSKLSASFLKNNGQKKFNYLQSFS